MIAEDLDAIDAGWDAEPAEERSGIRARPAARPAKPPLPLPVVARRFMRARRELEERLDSGERVAVEIDGMVYEVVRVADGLSPAGEVVRRGGLRVEERRSGR